jgi:hypothetical protein
MKISSEIIEQQDEYGLSIPVFVLYLDSEETGNKDKDCRYSANDFSSMIGNNNPEEILSFITPMLSELLYGYYGKTAEDNHKTPLTDWHATGFDRNSVNGVKL